MKKLLILTTVLGAVALSGTAMAADTATVSVSATVGGACKFVSPKTGAVAFTLDPTLASNATGVVTQPQFWCTNGVGFTITDDFGVHEATANTAPRRMQHSLTATEFIPYSFTYTSTGSGTGPLTPSTMNIAASVLNADYVNALSGSYSDTVTLSINTP